MNRKQWAMYWSGILSIPLLFLIFHLYNYVTQPNLGEYYTGKTVIYGACVLGLSGVVFISVNIYSFVVCVKNKLFFLWAYAFAGSVVLLVLSGLVLNKITKDFFPLDVWEQSTLNKLQQPLSKKSGND